MDKEDIDRLIKVEMDLFKIYVLLLVGFITGNISFLIRYIEKKEMYILVFFLLGILSFFIIIYLTYHTYSIILKLIKELRKCLQF